MGSCLLNTWAGPLSLELPGNFERNLNAFRDLNERKAVLLGPSHVNKTEAEDEGGEYITLHSLFDFFFSFPVGGDF